MRLLKDLIPAESGWSDLYPRAISNAGWIVGYGTNSAGRAHAFLMVPATTIPTLSEYGVAALVLLLLACGTVLLRSRAIRHDNIIRKEFDYERAEHVY